MMQGHTVKNMDVNSTTSSCGDGYSVTELHVCPCNASYTENYSVVLGQCIISTVIPYCHGSLDHFLAIA
jgi:hypothetical protein